MKRILPLTNAGNLRLPVRCACILVCCVTFFSSAFSQVQLLKDINTLEDVSESEYSELTLGDGKFYFINRGQELWKSTGSSGGTVRLKAFRSISKLTMSGNTLYFVADDGGGPELWKSNGTNASTVKVKEFIEGPTGGSPDLLTNVNGILFFVATNGKNGRELWKTDGTTAGTVMVKDILAKTGSSNPAFLTPVGGILYFAANDGINGYELWKSDGTESGTVLVKDIRTGSRQSSSPGALTNVYGTLFFTAADPATGRELYKSDGTEAGTVLVKDIRSGTSGSDIENMVAVGGALYFTAHDGIHGHEVWKSDGTTAGTVLLKDLTPGPAGSHGENPFEYRMSNFTNINGTLFFTAYQKSDYYIWKSDGTSAGTVPLFPCSGPGIYPPKPTFTWMNGKIYFFNQPDRSSYEEWLTLWRINPDGSGLTQVVPLAQMDAYSIYYPGMIMLNNSLYITGRLGQNDGFKLIKSNGTAAGTTVVKDVYQVTQGSNPHHFTAMNNAVFFHAEEELYGPSGLWRTNGTPAGTVKIHDAEDFPSGMAVMNNTLYYLSGFGTTLWKNDGISASQLLVEGEFAYASELTAVGNQLYLIDGNHGNIWRSDGTPQGTVNITNGMFDSPYYGGRSPRFQGSAGNIMIFTTDMPDGSGEELWRTDGTTAGTYMLRVMNTRHGRFYLPTAAKAKMNNLFFFVTRDDEHGLEVWRTDGTPSGTYMLADLRTLDPYEMDIRAMAVFNNTLYISAMDNTGVWKLYRSDGTTGVEEVMPLDAVNTIVVMRDFMYFFTWPTEYSSTWDLWISDGTREGTTWVKQLTGMNWGLDHTVIENIVYFRAYGQTALWRTDGTACGTFTVPIGWSPSTGMAAVGQSLVLGAHGAGVGVEPHVVNTTQIKSKCGSTVAHTRIASHPETRIKVGERELVENYPNPFQSDFTFRLNSLRDEAVKLDVFTPTGVLVTTHEGLKTNTDYQLGANWSNGIYILKASTATQQVTQKMVKGAR